MTTNELENNKVDQTVKSVAEVVKVKILDILKTEYSDMSENLQAVTIPSELDFSAIVQTKRKIRDYIDSELMTLNLDVELRSKLIYLYDNISADRIIGNVGQEWIVSHGKSCGTFLKRLSKWLYTDFQVKLPNTIISSLGNLMGKSATDSQTYKLDFTSDLLSFREGQFKDGGSCFYSCRSLAKNMLKDNGGIALRLYLEDNSKYGRAWLMTDSQSRPIIFNSYGLDIIKTARILSVYLGLSYKRIDLNNCGRSDGMLWINGGMGYVFDYPDGLNDISSYDFGLEDCQDICQSCNDYFDENQLTATNDGLICPDCLADHYFYCEDCEEYFNSYGQNELTIVDDSGYRSTNYYCDSCYDYHVQNMTRCEDCGDYTDYGQDIIGHGEVCPSCLEDNEYKYCEDCNEYFEDSDMSDDSHLCQDCYNTKQSDLIDDILISSNNTEYVKAELVDMSITELEDMLSEVNNGLIDRINEEGQNGQ